jgi:hypothetical protein
MGEKRNTYRIVLRRPEGKRPLGIPKLRLVDNIKMDLGEIEWGDMDWIDEAQDGDLLNALVNRVLNLFLSSCRTGGFLR